MQLSGNFSAGKTINDGSVLSTISSPFHLSPSTLAYEPYHYERNGRRVLKLSIEIKHHVGHAHFKRPSRDVKPHAKQSKC